MPRAKRGFKARRRRHRVLKKAKGYRGGQSKLFRTATERINRALQFSYRHRRAKKRDFRSLWITRLNAATHVFGLNYSLFMNGLKKLGVALNRKVLSEMAIHQPKAFEDLVKKVKQKLAA